ncbi:MAG TPA: helix-hairpin-helix domain-containing protein, partial [Thermoanaerobaculia bacterium]|nr:helix-hairpin-helix domain-containing protein [Thermoanaerobaculia bacterium]
MRQIRKGMTLLAALAAIVLLAPLSAGARTKAEGAAKSPAAGRVDINSASQAELEALPGVGAATAKKIIAGRPYSSVAELSRAGVSAKTVQKLSPLVTVGGAAALPRAASAEKPMKARAAAPAAPAGPVDLNTASQKELEALPGIGAATAKKIVAGRPYSSVADLSKAGVGAAAIRKLGPLVTVGGAATALPTRAGRATAPAAPSGAVDLNTASQKELEALPGIGAATAKKIVAGRP